MSVNLAPADAYNLAAAYYDRWKWQSVWRRHERPLVSRTLNSLRGRVAVDAGCGTGAYLSLLQRSFSVVHGVDLSTRMLDRAASSGARLHCADVRAIPLERGGADLVLSTRVLSHIPDLLPAFAEFARVGRPGSYLLHTDVHPEHRYERTRLPIQGGRVSVATHKHAFPEVFAAARTAGWRFRSGVEVGASPGSRDVMLSFALLFERS